MVGLFTGVTNGWGTLEEGELPMPDNEDKEQARRRQWWAWLDGQMAVRGWSQADLAKAAGVDESTLTSWKMLRRGVEAPQVILVAAGLKVAEWEALLAAGIMTQRPADAKPTDPRMQAIFNEIDELPTDEDRDMLLRIIRAYKAGRGDAPKTAVATKRARGRTDALAPVA